MSKITGDMTKIAAQIPALFETLSGMQMSDLLGKVRGISERGVTDRKSTDGKANGPAPTA